MTSRNLVAPTLVACLLAVGSLGIAPVANAEQAGQSLKASKSARKNTGAIKRRSRLVRIHLPIGPSRVYYDYPYYYSRGYYPTHIGGYVYYPYHYYYSYYRSDYRRHKGGPGSPRHLRTHSD